MERGWQSGVFKLAIMSGGPLCTRVLYGLGPLGGVLGWGLCIEPTSGQGRFTHQQGDAHKG